MRDHLEVLCHEDGRTVVHGLAGSTFRFEPTMGGEPGRMLM